MSEPKVLLEFRTRRGEMRITADHYVDEREGDGWKTLTPHHDPIDVALAVYDALSARHARVREAAETLAIRVDGMYLGQETRALLSALRAALETP